MDIYTLTCIVIVILMFAGWCISAALWCAYKDSAALWCANKDKASFFNKFISPAYAILDSDKNILCESLGITKEAYDEEMDKLSGLEETLLSQRVHDLLIKNGYLYSKKFRDKCPVGYTTLGGEKQEYDGCYMCDDNIRRLVNEIQHATQSECKCNALYAPPSREDIQHDNDLYTGFTGTKDSRSAKDSRSE